MVDAGEEDVWEQWFEAEVDVEVFVLFFGFGHAADDEDGDVGGEGAEVGDELGATHAGHEVVGHDEIDGGGVIVAAKLLEGALGAEDGDDEVAGSLEDGLTGRGLDGIVVDQEQRSWHGISGPVFQSCGVALGVNDGAPGCKRTIKGA
jgi:hypothetical protein